LNTGKIEEATYSSDFVWCPRRAKFVPENVTLVKEKGFKYVSALNKKSVMKKFKKNDNGSRIDWTKDKAEL